MSCIAAASVTEPQASKSGTVARRTDILIAGAGLAGSLAAIMLARAGYNVTIIDPHTVYPPDFRCEKLDEQQIRMLEKTGLADIALSAGTRYREEWIARFGRLVEKRAVEQYGIDYTELVNRLRDEMPEAVRFVHGKVTAIATGADRQTVTLAGGEQISARLVVVANGLNSGLREALGMPREELSRCHSVSIGFDIEPARPLLFESLTYFTEHARDRMAYLTLFPIGERMRANLFVYRDLSDPWLRAFKAEPRKALFDLLPKLSSLTGEFEVTGAIKLRPMDLYATTGYRQNGIVLVGDALNTACPAAGTGLSKVLTDVERLCNVHVPQWLATDGMGLEKIAAYYDDPVKIARDTHSAHKAYFARSLTIDSGLAWRARRWMRFVGGYAVGPCRRLMSVLRPAPALVTPAA